MSMRKIDCLEELLSFNQAAGEKADSAECLVLQMNSKCYLKKEWIRFLEVIASSSYSEMYLCLRDNRLDAWFLKRLMRLLSEMKKLKVISVDLNNNSFSFVSARDALLEFQRRYFPLEEITFQFNAQAKSKQQESIVMKCGKVQIKCSVRGMNSLAMFGVKTLRIELPKDMSSFTGVLLKLRKLIQKQACQFKVDIEKNGEKIAEFYGNSRSLLLITIVLDSSVDNLANEFFYQFPYSQFKQVILRDVNGLGNCFNRMKEFKSSSCWKSLNYNVYYQSYPRGLKGIGALMRQVTPISDELFLGLDSIEVRSKEQEIAIFETFIPKYCSIGAKIYLEFIEMYAQKGEIFDDSIFQLSKQDVNKRLQNSKESKKKQLKYQIIVIRYVDQSFLLRFLNRISDELRYGKDLNQVTSFKLRELPFYHSLSRSSKEMKQILRQPGCSEAKIERRKRLYKELSSSSGIESILVTKIILDETSSKTRRLEEEYYDFVTRIRSLNHLKIKQNIDSLLLMFSQILMCMRKSPMSKPFAYLTVTLVGKYEISNATKNLEIDLQGINRIAQLRFNYFGYFRQYFRQWKKNSRLLGFFLWGGKKNCEYLDDGYYQYCDREMCLRIKKNKKLTSEERIHFYHIETILRTYEHTYHDNVLCSYTKFSLCTCTFSKVQKAIKYYTDFDYNVAKFGLHLEDYE